ncbi:maleate cis-trans isomerase [Tamaricihabitans halophyticus]|uniref:Maleate cis-trans isomerase n=1 Tax=Tamaricihabitans halophyticus TaxID=1262583 RepID=A0A4R2QFP4_9PSEU|nr:decarboxylase [Tamaricihabitans halophyticus]TCP45825.1 maleate cis-trans isomerase [Tamaricihabitans halophyticus]
MTEKVIADENPIRLGLLYPDTRGSGEDDFYALARQIDPAIRIGLGYVPWPEGREKAHLLDGKGKREVLRGLGDAAGLRVAARAVRPMAPGAVTWACSSGSFLHGLEGARGQTRLIQAEAGAPASSTSMAYVAALAAMGITRVSLGSVYHPLVTDVLIELLADAGVETVHRIDLDARSDRQLAAWEGPRLLEIVDRSNTAAAEAVLIPETALHTAAHLEDLELRAGKPVLTATQVTLWHALLLMGIQRPQTGLGALFQVVNQPTSS